ncbi:MAG: NAD(P)-dependent alcohol dehydrogenase [Myxococcota bacterium]
MAQRSWSQGEKLTLIELPDPVPRGGEVRVRVKAVGVNPVDWKMRQQGPLRLAARLVGPPPPVVVGVDFAGVVDAVGGDVRDLQPGDRVVGATDFSRGQRGSHADTVLVRADQVCPLPDAVPFDVAAALPVAGVTAWRSVVQLGRITPGKRALILGASGGVGQLAVQVSKRVQGAFTVGVCSTRNVELVRSLGADVVVDYHAGNPLEQARAHGPFDVVVDCVGSYSGAGCRSLLARGGRHIMVAGDSPTAALQALVPPFSSRLMLGRPDGAWLRPLVSAVAAGTVTVNIAQRFPLTQAEDAHQLSQGGRVTGKIVLVV